MDRKMISHCYTIVASKTRFCYTSALPYAFISAVAQAMGRLNYSGPVRTEFFHAVRVYFLEKQMSLRTQAADAVELEITFNSTGLKELCTQQTERPYRVRGVIEPQLSASCRMVFLNIL